MSANEWQSDTTPKYLIPQITCPNCGKKLRLARMESDVPSNQSRMVFDCSCGFEYRMSERARSEV
jgi:C4-type Zn-finger protein